MFQYWERAFLRAIQVKQVSTLRPLLSFYNSLWFVSIYRYIYFLMMEGNKTYHPFTKPMPIICLIKMLSLIAILVILHFTVAAQTDTGPSKSKEESHRSVITDFFNLQASVQY